MAGRRVAGGAFGRIGIHLTNEGPPPVAYVTVQSEGFVVAVAVSASRCGMAPVRRLDSPIAECTGFTAPVEDSRRRWPQDWPMIGSLA